MEGAYNRLSPFSWSKRATKVFFAGFFLIMLPIYLYLGFQPADAYSSAERTTLSINSIKLNTPVVGLEMKNRQLVAPGKIAGSFSQHTNKELIIGHSSTVFQNLHQVELGDRITYHDVHYKVTTIETLLKSHINMAKILAPASTQTIIIMTCAGESLPDQDATHRLIITAEVI